MKLLILGIDGLGYDYLRKWPFHILRTWRDSARWGLMWSHERKTGPCWTSIQTGLTGTSHGVRTLLAVKPWAKAKHKKPAHAIGSLVFTERPHDYIFDRMSAHGLSMGSVNPPGLPEVRGIEGPGGGYLIAGWPYKPQSWPDSIQLPDWWVTGTSNCVQTQEHPQQFKKPENQMGWELHGWPFADWVDYMAHQELSKLHWVADNMPATDVLMVTTQYLDRAAHMLSSPSQGSGMGTLDDRWRKVQEKIDDWAGTALELFKPDQVAVCSDHGFTGRVHTHWGVWGVQTRRAKPGLHRPIDQVDFMPTMMGLFGHKYGVGAQEEGHRRDGWNVLAPMDFGTDDRPALVEDEEETQRHLLEGLGYL